MKIMPAARDTSAEYGAEMVHSVYRVAEFPVVAAVVGGVLGVYERVKHAPVPLVKRTLEAAEATAKYAAAEAYPFAVKFEKPIGYVDSLACKGLDVLEGSMPIVKKAPDQIVADAKAYLAEKALVPVDMVTRVKSFGVSKVEAASEYSRGVVLQAAKSPYGQLALQNVDAALTSVDSYLDKYITADPTEDEGFEEDENSDPALAPLTHAAALSSRIRRRVYKLTLAKAQAAQKKCADTLDQMSTHPTGFVDFVRVQLTSGSQALAEKTNAIWKETAASITPGRAAQAVTASMNVIEARTSLAARKLLQYLKWAYKVEENVEKKD